jgi:hypothetical protein
VDRASGDPGQPMTRAEVLAKFARYAGRPAAGGVPFLDRLLSRP